MPLSTLRTMWLRMSTVAGMDMPRRDRASPNTSSDTTRAVPGTSLDGPGSSVSDIWTGRARRGICHRIDRTPIRATTCNVWRSGVRNSRDPASKTPIQRHQHASARARPVGWSAAVRPGAEENSGSSRLRATVVISLVALYRHDAGPVASYVVWTLRMDHDWAALFKYRCRGSRQRAPPRYGFIARAGQARPLHAVAPDAPCQCDPALSPSRNSNFPYASITASTENRAHIASLAPTGG